MTNEQDGRTPRTDAEAFWIRRGENREQFQECEYVRAAVARQLERELTDERARANWIIDRAGAICHAQGICFPAGSPQREIAMALKYEIRALSRPEPKGETNAGAVSGGHDPATTDSNESPGAERLPSPAPDVMPTPLNLFINTSEGFRVASPNDNPLLERFVDMFDYDALRRHAEGLASKLALAQGGDKC